MDLFFRTATLLLHVLRFGYWVVAELQTNKEKPKTRTLSVKHIVKRGVALCIGLVVCFQLLGLNILPFHNYVLIQTVGFFFVVIGIIMTISARKKLGSNWAHAAEYQIRKDHQLVTEGVYRYIRHPLYTGIFLAVLGAEVVAGSYLFLIFLLLGAPAFYFQARQEEKILLRQFGSKYKKYMKPSKMFFPFW